MSKNIALNQEFYLATPKTKQQVNEIYNFSWFGCVLWNLFCPAATGLESSYNRSGKVMLDLPYATHRYLIEPLSGQQHMSITLIRNFLGFINKIKQSAKPVLRQLYSIAKDADRSLRC